MRRRIMVALVISQILGGLGVAIGIALATLLAAEISGTEGLAGLASTASVLGTAVLALPLAALMSRSGRRPGLVAGYLTAAAGAVLVVAASAVRSFPLLLAGMALFGAGSSANLQSRFAAADLAAPGQRARAISTVMAATTVGAVLGPNVAAPAGRTVSLLDTRIPVAAGPFVWAAGIFLLAAAAVAVLLRPDPLLTARALAEADRDRAAASGAPRVPDADRSLRAGLAAVTGSPPARLALTAVALAHTAMVSIMVMTPVALDHHGAGIELIGLVISVHVLGMYAFSPALGWLADRIGRLSVIMSAVALLFLAALLAGTAEGRHAQVGAGLFLLGLGWSAAVVAGSALLTDAVPGDRRAAAQGLSDLAMSGSAAVGGALAGVVVTVGGYGWLNLLGAALLLPVAALTLGGGARPRGKERVPR